MQDSRFLDEHELEQVTGGLSLPLSMTADHRFDGEGPLLTEVLRRGTRGHKRGTGGSIHHPALKKSSTNPGWCDDGFGIVPCR